MGVQAHDGAGRSPAGDRLLERELHVLAGLLDEAALGRDRLALIEGPAGIGKSQLLTEARERAAGSMTVLAARCSELERDFPFGVVRQLFEPLARDPGAVEAPVRGRGGAG